MIHLLIIFLLSLPCYSIDNTNESLAVTYRQKAEKLEDKYLDKATYYRIASKYYFLAGTKKFDHEAVVCLMEAIRIMEKNIESCGDILLDKK